MNAYYIKNGLCYLNRKFVQTNILLQNGVIQQISDEASAGEAAADNVIVYDAAGRMVVPGFIDIHTHGAVGVDVNAADAEDFAKISEFFARQGTTSWLCSILTDTKEQTMRCILEFKKSRTREDVGAELLGIHLEGPFLAPEYKGAMPEHLLRSADIELLKAYQEEAKGAIRYITVSPEVKGIVEMIPEIAKLGIAVAIGHSGADYDTAVKAIENGAMACTHTFNAMKLMHQHFPSISGAALESDIYCEAICDGRHLHPGMVRLLIKTKGIDRVVAVTDSIMAAGLPDGNYKLGVNDVAVVDGDAKLAENGVRAGSTLTTGKALTNLLEFTKRPLEDIIRLLTENPAKLIGIFERKGSIEVGKDADLVVLDSNYEVMDTFVKGNPVVK